MKLKNFNVFQESVLYEYLKRTVPNKNVFVLERGKKVYIEGAVIKNTRFPDAELITLSNGEEIPAEIEWSVADFVRHDHHRHKSFKRFRSEGGALIVVDDTGAREFKKKYNIKRIFKIPDYDLQSFIINNSDVLLRLQLGLEQPVESGFFFQKLGSSPREGQLVSARTNFFEGHVAKNKNYSIPPAIKSGFWGISEDRYRSAAANYRSIRKGDTVIFFSTRGIGPRYSYQQTLDAAKNNEAFISDIFISELVTHLFLASDTKTRAVLTAHPKGYLWAIEDAQQKLTHPYIFRFRQHPRHGIFIQHEIPLKRFSPETIKFIYGAAMLHPVRKADQKVYLDFLAGIVKAIGGTSKEDA